MESDSDFPHLPLFGETRSRDRISFIIIAAVTTVFVLTTFVTTLFIHISKVTGPDVFLNICLLLFLASHLCLAFWYRSGDLEPRFRNMLFFNTAVIILLCICTYLIINKK